MELGTERNVYNTFSSIGWGFQVNPDDDLFSSAIKWHGIYLHPYKLDEQKLLNDFYFGLISKTNSLTSFDLPQTKTWIYQIQAAKDTYENVQLFEALEAG